MTNHAIQVEGLGKEYVIGGAEQRHDSFRELLSGALTSPLRKLRRLGGTANEDQRFWALRDVSFNVEQGEVLGIIGRNGAGKSTLLKILSRITSPTEGKIVTRGRVASLLEVGTGFHPELTGKENIYLNGAILGMPRGEIDRCFDQIVEFAGISKFLDTPVKRYSSGMYIRLAFSVAAHLRAETLLVDEVLAVGDIDFQSKCLGKLTELGEAGKTALFVSHNLAMIRKLCTRVLILDQGRISHIGGPSELLSRYQESALRSPSEPCVGEPGLLYSAPCSSEPTTHRLHRVILRDAEGQQKLSIQTWDYFKLIFEFKCLASVDRAAVSVFVYTLDGLPLLECSSFQDNDLLFSLSPPRCRVTWATKQFPLAAGRYLLGVGLSERGTKWLCFDRMPMTVEENDVYKTGYSPTSDRRFIVPDYQWEVSD